MDVNDSFLRMLEYTRKEVIDHTSAELNIFVDPSERVGILKTFLEKGSVQNQEITVQTKTGKLLTVFLSNTKINIGGQEYALSMIFDIT